MWHFAHHKVEIGETCADSAIHAAAKQVLLEQNWLTVPELTIVVSSQTKLGLVWRQLDFPLTSIKVAALMQPPRSSR